MVSEAGIRAGGRVVGRYVLYDELAAGGMATVHIGRLLGEVGFSRSVAIKRLHPQFAHDPEFVNMFLEEARIAARIRHPNVVPVLDVVQLEDELFLVMEYIQGETLTRLTRVSRSRNRIIPMNIALAIGVDMLGGLHAAHEARDESGQPLHIVHRDVSPHNVMVGHDGVARVLDFGIAKASSSAQATREGEVRGKFSYMSPEQLASVPVDRRADVFAASIVLWEMLTGQRLFQANDPAGIVGKVLHGVIKTPGSVAGGLPPALDDIVMKGLERDVNKRFSSALEMARALEGLRLEIARHNEVGGWVDRIAGDILKKRAKRIAEIESTGSYSTSHPLIPATATSTSSLPESTSSRSQSGLRTRDPAPSAPLADDSAPVRVEVVEGPAPRRRSRVGLVLVVGLVAALAGASVFVLRSGGVAPARAKVARLFDRSTPTGMGVSVAAPSASVALATSSSSQVQNIETNNIIDTTTGGPSARPSYGFRSGQRPGGTGVRPGADNDTTQGATDPKHTHTLGVGAGGQSGDLGGGGASVGKDAIQQNAVGANTTPQRPSLAQVQIAMGAVMPNVRSCLLPDDPPSRAMVTFQSDGSAKTVTITGFAAGKAQEGCVRSALMRARVDPFKDPTFVVPVTVRPP